MKLIVLKIDIDGTMTKLTDLGRAWSLDDLGGNPALQVIQDAASVPADYEDISTIENWSIHGWGLIGSAVAFRDWKALRSEIKSLALAKTSDDIQTNWESLSTAEQQIACQYLTNLVAGADFISTYTDAATRLSLSLNFDKLSTQAREQRYFVLRSVLMGAIGADNGILFFEDAVREQRVFAYIGGIESYSEEGVSGLTDFVSGTNKYDDHAVYDNAANYDSGDYCDLNGVCYLCISDATSGVSPETNTAKWELLGQKSHLLGLRHRGFQIVDGSGNSLDQVCDQMIGIINGLY